MSTAKDEILQRIRSALGPQRRSVEVPREYRPADPGAPGALDVFTDRLEDYKASVHRAPPETVAGVIAGLLAAAGRVIVPDGLPDGWAPGATVDDGHSAVELDAFDTVLTTCAAAAAETGTIVLDAGPGQGRRAVSLIPDRHICVVRAEQVVPGVPELLARLDPRRPLTFISGPSATSDIELQRVEGVHGPRTLIVVLVAAAG